MKKYKIWIFYLVSDHDVYGTDPNDIYAYTTDERLAALFTMQRNMDNFYMKSMKVNNKELNKIYEDYMDNDLTELESTTRKSKSMKSIKCEFILTRRESMVCMSQASLYVNEYLYKNIVINPMVFEKEYLRALMTIRYLPLYEYIKGINIIHDDVHEHIYPDMVNIVLDNFGELFCEGGI